MQKPISELFKTTLKFLRGSDHKEFYSVYVIKALSGAVANTQSLQELYTEVKKLFEKEVALSESAPVATLTPDLKLLHQERIAAFSLFYRTVNYAKFAKTGSKKQAYTILKDLTAKFRRSRYGSYAQVTDELAKFVSICEQPQYLPSLQALGLILLRDELNAANKAFKQRYNERQIERERINGKDKIAKVRANLDTVLLEFVETVNITHYMNEHNLKDPILKENLALIIKSINTGLKNAEEAVAHRKANQLKANRRKAKEQEIEKEKENDNNNNDIE
ncbi:MAG: DUF6261 family protein [Tannerellaceae bacterium]|jgi:hypothetical protein|nr:DUF6261 family protein [Tannerellaceae bacterium]